MIALVEPVCSRWIHEEVNAGFLQIITNHENGEILYIGEQEHIRCVRRIYDHSGIRFAAIRKTVPIEKADLYDNTAYYIKLLHDILITYRPEKLLILCGYRPCILAAEIVSFRYRHINVYFVLHGMIEEGKGRRESYRKLFWYSRFCKKLRFISYSPYCTGNYWGTSKDKFIFLHHPYIHRNQKVLSRKEKKADTKIIIGIIGACANQKAIRLISMLNRNHENGEYEFWVASKFGKKFAALPNVKVLNLEFERKKMEALMQKMDYLLLPYGRSEYTVSASGVLWDAIENRLPCLMLDSSYLTYYMTYHIGYQADSVEKLCNIICDELLQGKRAPAAFFVHLDKLEQERDETVSAILHEIRCSGNIRQIYRSKQQV